MLKFLQQRPLTVFLAVFFLAFAGHLVWLTWRTPLPQERTITLMARKFAYNPNIIEVNRGDRVHIRMVSEDVHHGFYLDGYEVEMTAQPSLAGGVDFLADKPGKYAFRCSMTCGPFHPYMIGYLRVKPDYRLAGSLWLSGGIFGFLVVYLSGRRGRNGQEAGEEVTKNHEEAAP